LREQFRQVAEHRKTLADAQQCPYCLTTLNERGRLQAVARCEQANAELAAQGSANKERLALLQGEVAEAQAALAEERGRLAAEVRALGLRPLPSWTNFLCVPVEDAEGLAESLLAAGVVVRVQPGAIRFSVRDRADDDLLLQALARALEHPSYRLQLGNDRAARHLRVTAETRMRVRLRLDGAGRVRVATGAGLYDHLLEQLAFHGGLDLLLDGVGDLETGDHHTAEDAALALAEALDRALGDRRGIARYGDAVVPMDDALARASVDLGGRAWAELRLERDPGLAEHALRSLAQAGRLALHIEATGRDEHHVAEAAFKAVGRALRAAVRRNGSVVPSTKGVL
jgi:imidazoleglycerol phosphate dehydratase HisB